MNTMAKTVRLSAGDIDTISYALALVAAISVHNGDARTAARNRTTLKKLTDARTEGALLELAPFAESVLDSLKGRG